MLEDSLRLEKIIKDIVSNECQVEVLLLCPIIQNFLSRPHNAAIKRYVDEMLLYCHTRTLHHTIPPTVTYMGFHTPTPTTQKKLMVIANRIYYELGGTWFFNNIPIPEIYNKMMVFFSGRDITYCLIVLYIFNNNLSYSRKVIWL